MDDASLHNACRRPDLSSFGMQAVPAKLSRYGLSQVINGLLELGELLLNHIAFLNVTT